MWIIKEPEQDSVEQPVSEDETVDSCDDPSDETEESETQGIYNRIEPFKRIIT